MARSITSALHAALTNSPKLARMTQMDVAKATGIHQSQVSRMMRGDFKRVAARNLTTLCRYAGVSLSDRRSTSPLLTRTVQAVWDGSPDHEKALVKLLRAAEMLAVAHAAQPDVHIVGRRRRR